MSKSRGEWKHIPAAKDLNAWDDGTSHPGHNRNQSRMTPKRKKRTDWAKLYRDAGDEHATEADRLLAARGSKVPIEFVPENVSVAELLVWTRTRAALAGDDKASGDVLDRVAPKPSRIAADPNGGPVRRKQNEMASPGEQAAENYMESLLGEEEDPGANEFL